MLDAIGIRLFIKEFFENTEINPDNVTVNFELAHRTLKIDVWYRPLMVYEFTEIGYKAITEESEIVPALLHRLVKDLLWGIERETQKRELK